MKKTIKIKFQNGLSLDVFKHEVFDIHGVSDDYEFEESSMPDFIVFGPYGNDIPAPGNYVRIGYYCENFMPDMSVCEWAFGVPHEKEINHPRYKRIQWHGLDPQVLVKPGDYDAEEILASKKHFCNFVYSNQVPYREAFVKELSKYKKIDAPGRSMKNTDIDIDKKYTGDRWQRKRQFLSEYKFTIAFENYAYPGYQTEKLYDAMQANSIPVYCGDRFVGDIFNTQSFVNVYDQLKPVSSFVRGLEKISQQNFVDTRPQFYNNPLQRLRRKIKAIGRQAKMNMEFSRSGFNDVIGRIIELDRDDHAYLRMLKQPWFVNNTPPQNTMDKARWQEVFNSRP